MHINNGILKKNFKKVYINACYRHESVVKMFFACDETTFDYVCNYKDKFQSKTKYVVAFLTDECLATFASVKKRN